MKIGWLVIDTNSSLYEYIEFYKEKPEYYSGRLVQIVYTEVIEDAN